MIIEDYVSFEIAKLLKEKRFNENVLTYYIYNSEAKTYEFRFDNRWDNPNNFPADCISAPTLQMAMKWLREKHKITIGTLFKGDRIYYEIHQNNEFVFGVDTPESYEKVCDEAIKYCLKFLT